MLKDINIKQPGLARAGKIRLGYMLRKCPHCKTAIKAKLDRCPSCTKPVKPAGRNESYPTGADHFVLDDAPQVAKIYGDQPRRLNIWFPFEGIEQNIPSAYRLYSAASMLCQGDGERITYAMDRTSGRPIVREGIALQDIEERTPDGKTIKFKAGQVLPCPGRERDLYSKCHLCRPQMTIKVMIREIPNYATFDIVTGSVNTYARLHEQLSFFAAPKEQGGLGVPLRGIPFVLVLKPESVSVPNLGKDGQPKKGEPPRRRVEKYLLSLEVDEEFMKELNQVHHRLAQPSVLLNWSEPDDDEPDFIALPELEEDEPFASAMMIDHPTSDLSELSKLDFFKKVKDDLGIVPQTAGWLIKRAGLVNGEYNPDNAQAMWNLLEQARPLLDFIDEVMNRIPFFGDQVQVLEQIEEEITGADHENGVMDFKVELKPVLLDKLTVFANGQADEQAAQEELPF